MVEKVTKEERMVSLAIEKAKELIQAFQDGTTVEMEGDLQGEEIKLKSPKKNPAEEKVNNPIGKDEGYGYVTKDANTIVKEVLTKVNRNSMSRGNWFSVLKTWDESEDPYSTEHQRDYKGVGGQEDDEYNPELQADKEKLIDEQIESLRDEQEMLQTEANELYRDNPKSEKYPDGKNTAEARKKMNRIAAIDSQINEIGKAIIILNKLFK